MKKLFLSIIFMIHFSIPIMASEKTPDIVIKEAVECVICSNPLRDKIQLTSVLPCHATHAFHAECISDWLAIPGTKCPMCRVAAPKQGPRAQFIEELLAQSKKAEEKEADIRKDMLNITTKKRKAEVALQNAYKEIGRKEFVIRRLNNQKRAFLDTLGRQEVALTPIKKESCS